MNIAPCKDCKVRELNCHGKCELYKQWKQERTKENRYNKKLRESSIEMESLAKGYRV